MTADDKYSLPNSENLQQPVHMQLFKQQKIFFSILSCISQNYITFPACSKRDVPDSLCISEIRDCESRG